MLDHGEQVAEGTPEQLVPRGAVPDGRHRPVDTVRRALIWPEHMDVSISLTARTYGVSPGDETIPVPYAYLGPATPQTGPFWNQPFGAARPLEEFPARRGCGQRLLPDRPPARVRRAAMTGQTDPRRSRRQTGGAWFHDGQASATTAEPDCLEVVELVTDYLDGVLEPPLAAAVERHLALCPPCVEYVRQMRETARLLGQLPEETLSEPAPAEILAAFRGFQPSAAYP